MTEINKSNNLYLSIIFLSIILLLIISLFFLFNNNFVANKKIKEQTIYIDLICNMSQNSVHLNNDFIDMFNKENNLTLSHVNYINCSDFK